MSKTIKIGELSLKLTDDDILNDEVFEVDFGGILLQITKTGSGYKVTNGVDGHGQNLRKFYELITISVGFL